MSYPTLMYVTRKDVCCNADYYSWTVVAVFRVTTDSLQRLKLQSSGNFEKTVKSPIQVHIVHDRVWTACKGLVRGNPRGNLRVAHASGHSV